MAFVRVALLASLASCARPVEPRSSRDTRPVAAAESPAVTATNEPPSACVGAAPAARPSGAMAVTGQPLSPCPSRHRTGFSRDGFCAVGPDDSGVHAVCAQVTAAFLAFSRSRGNDLVTPRGSFPGLREGDGWCLCAARWREADEAGVAPPVILAATSDAALATVSREALARHARETP